MSYATPADIIGRFRELDENETSIVTTRLGDAEILIKSRIPDLDAQVLAGTIDEQTVVMVEADMVLRLIRNPDGYMQESDGNYSYMISNQVASGKLTVEAHEWALLGIRGAVYTIKTYMLMPWDNV